MWFTEPLKLYKSPQLWSLGGCTGQMAEGPMVFLSFLGLKAGPWFGTLPATTPLQSLICNTVPYRQVPYRRRQLQSNVAITRTLDHHTTSFLWPLSPLVCLVKMLCPFSKIWHVGHEQLHKIHFPISNGAKE